VVYHSNQQMFKDILKVTEGKAFVVQKYVNRPFLISGYKFHFRMYTILAGVNPFRAYLLRDGHALFSTKQFTLSKKTLAENFDKFVHLTNYSVNFSKGNKHLPEEKPGIGIGCEWTVKTILRMIKKERPEFDPTSWWKELSLLCAHTMHSISQWKYVQKHKKLNNTHTRIEAFGCDIMMDSNFKIYLMEANTQVGLQPTLERFPEESCTAKICGKNGCKFCKGAKNPRAKQVNAVTKNVVNATLDILQFDCERQDLGKTLVNLHEIIDKDLKDC